MTVKGGVMMWRRRLLLPISIAFLLGTVGFPSASVFGAVGERAVLGHATSDDYYVALGDSYSSGEGNPPRGDYLVPGQQNYAWLNTNGVPWETDDGCHRSPLAFPTLIKSWLKSETALSVSNFRFLACSDATTRDLWNSGSPFEAGPSTKEDSSSQQLVTGATDLADARIVTVTIGGDDIHFSDVVTNCIDFTQHACDSSSNDGWIADLDQNIRKLEPVLVKTYEAIEAKSLNATLYVVGYPDLFPTQPSTLQQNVTCPAATKSPTGAIPAHGIGYLAYAESELSSVIEEAANESGAQYVDPNSGPESFIGHSVCASTSWFNKVNPVHPEYSFHPNVAGQAALAVDVEAAIKNTVKTSPIGPAIQISAGGAHACVLIASGTVDCWGDNSLGKLGNGNTTNSDTPEEVPGLSRVTQIAASDVYTCAVASSAVDCWGDDSYGELGNGTTTDSYVPEPVPGLIGVTQVAVGTFHTCALLIGGTVDCWGDNHYGQLGNDTTNNSLVPVAVNGLTGVADISASAYNTCALMNSGTVECWGDNGEGQLGNGNTISSSVPEVVPGLSGVTQIENSGVGDCTVLVGGTVDCWGAAYVASDDFASTPEAVPGLTGVTQVAIADGGSGFTCARITGGTVRCWGANNLGQLGNGDTITTNSPVPVANLASVSQVSTGDEFACALLNDGSVDCWGDNIVGELGNGDTTQSSIPVAVKGL
jgi:hypothetical protein